MLTLTVNEQANHTVYRSEQRLVDGWIVYVYVATFGDGLQLVGAVGFKEEWDVCEHLLDDVMGDLSTVAERSWQC